MAAAIGRLQMSDDLAGCRNAYLGWPGDLWQALQAQLTDGELMGRELCLELAQETGYLMPLQACAVFVEDAGDMLSALYKSVEVVGIDANPVTRRSETVALAYNGRNEAVQIGETRQASLLDGEKKQMTEVETAGLENTHELEAVSRLAVEGNADSSKQRAEE